MLIADDNLWVSRSVPITSTCEPTTTSPKKTECLEEPRKAQPLHVFFSRGPGGFVHCPLSNQFDTWAICNQILEFWRCVFFSVQGANHRSRRSCENTCDWLPTILLRWATGLKRLCAPRPMVFYHQFPYEKVPDLEKTHP